MSKSIFAAVAAASVLAIGTQSASAQSGPARDQTNQWELTLVGAGSSDNDFDAGGFNVNAQLGYYFTQQLQGLVRQTAGYNDNGSDDSWGGSTRVGVAYHFDYDQDFPVIPYIGVNLGYQYGDLADTWIAGPEIGVKWYVNSTTFIFGSVAYDFFFEDVDDADEGFDDGQFIYGLGIGFRF